MAKDPAQGRPSDGNHIVLNGRKIALKHHETDFSVLCSASDLKANVATDALELTSLGRKSTRVHVSTKGNRDEAIDVVRQRAVAHHIYEVEDTGEEILIDDHVLLRLRHHDPRALREILDEFSLVEAGRMGDTHVLQLTEVTGANPVKTANRIAQRAEVESCSPQVMVEVQRHDSLAASLALFDEQWYLSADTSSSMDVRPDADIRAPEAWMVTRGAEEVVIAIMDDGVDLGHPAFERKRIHPAAKDFAANPDDGVPTPGANDFHGTPVASIATGNGGAAMTGVAPGCTLLPIRIGFGLFNQFETLNEFRHASAHADVLNCSFGFPPLSFDLFDAGFRQEIAQMTRTGGRRGKGLVIVFSAGNDDAPTRLRAADNVNGVRFFRPPNNVAAIGPGREVFSAYPSIPGVVVVAAMSSRLRKSGYSNWGEHITLTAPSSNGHELRGLADFRAVYRGLGQIGAVNRPGFGRPSRPLRDNPLTPNIRENFYTDDFGGTSGAAPVVAGVAALMLSVNPQLSAEDVTRILMATADKQLDTATDLANDPNLQGKTGEFVDGHSLFFGAGKVDAFAAVRRASALAGGGNAGTRSGSVEPELRIPDASSLGVVSGIELTGNGPVRGLKVSVAISHTYRGDLSITLISPEGFTATLETTDPRDGQPDVNREYTSLSSAQLAALAGARGKGEWRLHVADRLHQDRGTLHRWSIELED